MTDRQFKLIRSTLEWMALMVFTGIVAVFSLVDDHSYNTSPSSILLFVSVVAFTLCLTSFMTILVIHANYMRAQESENLAS